jgi:hypothetical protein
MIVPLVAFFIVGSFAGGHAVSALSLPAVETPERDDRDDRSSRAAGGVACRSVLLRRWCPLRDQPLVRQHSRSERCPAVTDPSGAVLPGATVFLKSQSSSEGGPP